MVQSEVQVLDQGATFFVSELCIYAYEASNHMAFKLTKQSVCSPIDEIAKKKKRRTQCIRLTYKVHLLALELPWLSEQKISSYKLYN